MLYEAWTDRCHARRVCLYIYIYIYIYICTQLCICFCFIIIIISSSSSSSSSKLDVHESVHRDTTMKIANKIHYID